MSRPPGIVSVGRTRDGLRRVRLRAGLSTAERWAAYRAAGVVLIEPEPVRASRRQRAEPVRRGRRGGGRAA